MPLGAKDFVESELPREHQIKLPPALENAYAAVAALYKNEPLFSVTSAIYGKGHVVAWAVDLQIERLIKGGQLPFDYRWVPFEKPTGRFLQLRLSASTLSISQLQHKASLPRPADFRHNRILNNNLWLDLPEFEDEHRISGLPHLILTHGYQTLSFAHVGLLNRVGRRLVWTYRTPNLMDLPRIVAPDMPPPEGIDIEIDVSVRELKDEINRYVRDHTE
jgi:hypothetical protein